MSEQTKKPDTGQAAPKTLREQLGLPADATDDVVSAKVAELVARPTEEQAAAKKPAAKKKTPPATKPYRVCIAGAIYDRFVETVGPDGEDEVVRVRDLALFGQEIELTSREAKRLTDLSAVKPANEPLSYDEMNDKQLDEQVKAAGITVRSTGADPDQPQRIDKINALVTYDQGRGVAGQPAIPAS